MSNFSLSQKVVYPFGELSAIFIEVKIVVCKVLQFARVIWEKVNKTTKLMTCPYPKHLLVVLRYNATLTAKVISWPSVTHMSVFPGFLKPVLTQISFQSHQLLFPYASAEVRGERNFTPTGSQAHNHQVMSPTCSPLSHPNGCSPLSHPNGAPKHLQIIVRSKHCEQKIKF